MAVAGLLAVSAAPVALTPSAVAQGSTTTTRPGGATIVDPPAGDPVDPAASPAPGTTPGATTPEIPAASVPNGALIDGPDRAELAQALAEATTETDVCFAYTVNVSGGTGGRPSSDQVSNGGPDRSSPVGSCSKGTLALDVSIRYTCNSCESEDSASYRVSSSVAGLSGSDAKRRLERLTGIDDKAFLGDDDDLALRNATAALPLLVGGDPATPTAQAAAPDGDRLTGKPGSDWLRANGIGALISLVVLIVALVVACAGLRMLRAARRASGRGATFGGRPAPAGSAASTTSGSGTTAATGGPATPGRTGETTTTTAPSRWAAIPPSDPSPTSPSTGESPAPDPDDADASDDGASDAVPEYRVRSADDEPATGGTRDEPTDDRPGDDPTTTP
ncbi:MAG: hypothetical protein AB7G37_11750 [Solirubrobacteraceae bacterium]